MDFYQYKLQRSKIKALLKYFAKIINNKTIGIETKMNGSMICSPVTELYLQLKEIIDSDQRYDLNELMVAGDAAMILCLLRNNGYLSDNTAAIDFTPSSVKYIQEFCDIFYNKNITIINGVIKMDDLYLASILNCNTTIRSLLIQGLVGNELSIIKNLGVAMSAYWGECLIDLRLEGRWIDIGMNAVVLWGNKILVKRDNSDGSSMFLIKFGNYDVTCLGKYIVLANGILQQLNDTSDRNDPLIKLTTLTSALMIIIQTEL